MSGRRLSPPAALTFRRCRQTFLMFCLARWRASGRASRVSGKLEFYCTQVSLKFPFSLFCLRTPVLVWLISRPVIGAIITVVHWLFLSNATFGALNKDSHCSLEIKESIDFVLKLKNFPQGPEILENGVLGAKHLELEHRPHIHNKALELKAMWRNLQRPETGLNQSPVVTLQNPHHHHHSSSTPPPPKQFELVLSSTMTPQNMALAELFISKGETKCEES